VACAASQDPARAQDFANRHKIPKWYGNYEDFVADPNVDIVYVGNVHAFRRSVGELCLLANKHVLLEKPFTCNPQDAEHLIQLAQERNLFLMEGMWTRFFPAFELARKIVEDGLLGEVVQVVSDFNFNASDSEEYPASFVYNRKLGGGAALLVAPYPIAAALAFFDSRMPSSIRCTGQVDTQTGVDLQSAVLLEFAPTSTHPHKTDPDNQDNIHVSPKLPGAGLAILSFGMLGESEETTAVVGTKGRLTIHSPGHCPTKITVTLKGVGRGNSADTKVYEFPLPSDTDEIIKAGGWEYPNSAGFCYEAAAIARCIHQNKRTCPQMTLEETLICQRVLQDIRHQLRVKAVDED
jgi:dihydrodiol dehydrogenase / D-xylose 1-dehydrogenase (NADP)